MDKTYRFNGSCGFCRVGFIDFSSEWGYGPSDGELWDSVGALRREGTRGDTDGWVEVVRGGDHVVLRVGTLVPNLRRSGFV